MFCFISCIFRPWLHYLLPGWEAALLHGERPGEELEALCSNPAPLLCHDDRPVTDVWLQTSLARWDRDITLFPTLFFFLISRVSLWFLGVFFQYIVRVQTWWCAVDFPCSWIDAGVSQQLARTDLQSFRPLPQHPLLPHSRHFWSAAPRQISCICHCCLRVLQNSGVRCNWYRRLSCVTVQKTLPSIISFTFLDPLYGHLCSFLALPMSSAK